MRLRREERAGTTLVESAIVYPIVLLLLLGLAICGLGIFRTHQVSALARRAARYASVHGKDYAKDTGNPAATPADIFNNVIVAQGIGLAADRLTYSVTYNTENSAGTPVTQNGKVISVGNTVTVTVNYAWLPEAFLGGVNLTSTSVMPMSY